jgi:hypothetical protein
VGIGIGGKSSLDRTKTDSEVETGHSKTDESWMVVGDRHEESKGKYEDRVNWESSVAGWRMGKDTGFGSSRVVDSSAGALTGQRNDGGRQDDQRWIRRQ